MGFSGDGLQEARRQLLYVKQPKGSVSCSRSDCCGAFAQTGPKRQFQLDPCHRPAAHLALTRSLHASEHQTLAI